MTASDYLRLKYTSDRHLAMTTQNAIGGVMQSARGVASDIYSGIERVSWYSSCFIPKYNDICQELKAEEIRTAYSIASIFRYRDVIAYMLYLYFEMLSDDIKEGNEEGSARKFIRDVSWLVAQFRVTGLTRYVLAESAAAALAHSDFLSKIVVERVSAGVPRAVFGLQFFGMEQKAALAARHLKAIQPDYYWILYQARLEMLYYFVEPLLAGMIKKVRETAFENMDELTDFIRDNYGV